MTNFSVEAMARKHCLHYWSIEHGVNPGPNECRKDAIIAAVNETLEEAEKIAQHTDWNDAEGKRTSSPLDPLEHHMMERMQDRIAASIAALRIPMEMPGVS